MTRFDLWCLHLLDGGDTINRNEDGRVFDLTLQEGDLDLVVDALHQHVALIMKNATLLGDSKSGGKSRHLISGFSEEITKENTASFTLYDGNQHADLLVNEFSSSLSAATNLLAFCSLFGGSF